MTDIVDAPKMLDYCERCGRTNVEAAPPSGEGICVDCYHAQIVRDTHKRQHTDWITIAKDSGLSLWTQQPGETQWEYTIWCAFRDSYPGKKPTYGDVAEQLGVTYNVVKKAAQRWSYPVRMQAWMQECDRVTLAQRRQEILDMNADHVSMAAKIRQKLNTAIDLVAPEALKPGEIVALAKLSAELERKARIDTIAQDEMRRDLLADVDNPELKKTPTKTGDLQEIVAILAKAGALGDMAQIGVRETTTTTREVVVKDSADQSATLTTEG